MKYISVFDSESEFNDVSRGLPRPQLSKTGDKVFSLSIQTEPYADEIWYTSTDGKVVNPYNIASFDVSLLTNKYSNGKGLMTFNSTLTTLGDSVFNNCTKLLTIKLSNSLTTIDGNAFNGCSGLLNINIPSSVTSLKSNAFNGCSSLTSMTVASGNTVYDSRNNCNAIIETSNNRLIHGCQNTIIPDNVTSLAQYAFAWCSTLTNITIPASVTRINMSAFKNCIALATLTSLNTTPPYLEGGVFENVPTMTVYVPASAVSAYQSAS